MINLGENKFNTEIMQKVAEINEAISVADNTESKDCKRLNILVSIYNLSNMLNWLDEQICKKDNGINIIRNDNSKIPSKICSKKINSYALGVLSVTLIDIDQKMEGMISSFEDDRWKGYHLMKDDYLSISDQIKDFQMFVESL